MGMQPTGMSLDVSENLGGGGGVSRRLIPGVRPQSAPCVTRAPNCG